MTKKKKEYTNPTYPTGTLFSSGREYLHSTIFTKPAEKREQLKQRINDILHDELKGLVPWAHERMAELIMKEIEKP